MANVKIHKCHFLHFGFSLRYFSFVVKESNTHTDRHRVIDKSLAICEILQIDLKGHSLIICNLIVSWKWQNVGLWIKLSCKNTILAPSNSSIISGSGITKNCNGVYWILARRGRGGSEGVTSGKLFRMNYTFWCILLIIYHPRKFDRKLPAFWLILSASWHFLERRSWVLLLGNI